MQKKSKAQEEDKKKELDPATYAQDDKKGGRIVQKVSAQILYIA